MNLEKGNTYQVKIKGNKRSVKRIFLYSEKRFNSIDCFVFTSRVLGKIETRLSESGSVIMRGRNLPAQEISIPFYDLQYANLLIPPYKKEKEAQIGNG